jgi:hypothetical protein
MANVTITLDDALLAEVRREAERAGKSVSRYLADVLKAAQDQRQAERMAAMEQFLELAKYVPTEGEPWKFDRDEIYDRPYPGGHQRGDLQPRWPSAEQAAKVRGVAEGADGGQFNDRQPASVQRSVQRRKKKDTSSG